MRPATAQYVGHDGICMLCGVRADAAHLVSATHWFRAIERSGSE